MFLAVWEIFKRLSPFIAIALVALLVAAGVKVGSLTTELSKVNSKLTTTTQELSTEKERYNTALAAGKTDLEKAQEENRKLNASWQVSFNQAGKDHSNEKKRLESLYSGAVSERDRLRIATKGRTSADSLNASGETCDPGAFRRTARASETFGELLSICDGVSETLGREAEGLAGQVRGLTESLRALRENAPK